MASVEGSGARLGTTEEVVEAARLGVEEGLEVIEEDLFFECVNV